MLDDPNCKVRDLRFKHNIQPNYIPNTLNGMAFSRKGNFLVDLLLKLWKNNSVIGHILAFKRSAFPRNGCVICVKKQIPVPDSDPAFEIVFSSSSTDI